MANNKIKGLTVEIGGDTTKLGKALESIERQTRDMTSELSEIDKLLKFNPESTDLLAQKQKVLGGIVENTAEKLKKLKEAEKQVQAQFERGEASEEQVRALQREIIQTESKLEKYQKAARDAAEATEALAQASSKAGQASKKVRGALDSAKQGVAELDKGKGSADAFRVAAGGALSKVGVALKVVGAAAGAVVGGLVAAAEASREYRTEMGKLDAAFSSSGHGADTASEAYKALYGVIGEVDQSVEAAQQIALLADSSEDVAKWADLAAGVVGKFGDALQPETFFEAANETIKLGEATGAYTQMLEGVGMNVDEFNAGLAECTTEAEKQQYMLAITEQALGTAGTAYREANAEIIRANEASQAWSASLADVGASVDPIITDVKLLGASLLSEFIPSIQDATGAFRGLLNGEDGAAADLGAALSGIIDGLLNKAAELAPAVAEAGTSLVTSLATTLIESIPDLVETAIVLFTSIIEGLTEATPSIVDALVKMMPRLTQALASTAPQLLRAAIDLFMALVRALPSVIDALMRELPTLGKSLIGSILDMIPDMADAGKQLLLGLWKGINDNIKWLKKKLKGFVNDSLDTIKDFFGIHSPSKKTAYFGEMLDEGLAQGVEDNADAPIKAMRGLSEGMVDEMENLNGLTLERQLNHTFSGGASASQSVDILGKLDQLLQAVERGQVLYLDGTTLVGSTAGRYDANLGQRRALAARGAL